jgi:hypothetical protein
VARDMRLDVRIDGGYLAGLEGDPLRGRAYAATVKRLAWLRSGGEFAYWYIQRLQERPDPEQFFAEAQERLQQLQPPAKTQRFVYGWDTVSGHRADIAQRVQDAKDGKVSPYLWPWASWNRDVRPLRPGMLGLVAASDGMGKSTFLECIAEHWAKGGLHVVYVHLEDALDYKLDRRLARWARVPLQAIEDGTQTDEQQAQMDKAQANIDRFLPTLHYFDAAGMSAAEILTELKARVGEGVCQAVVLDYLDKMQPSRAQAKLYGDQIWERQGNDVEMGRLACAWTTCMWSWAANGQWSAARWTGARGRHDAPAPPPRPQPAQRPRAQQGYTQDFPPLALTPAERAAWKYCNVVALLADSGPQYDNLPPAARMATDAAKHAAALLEPLLKAKGGG